MARVNGRPDGRAAAGSGRRRPGGRRGAGPGRLLEDDAPLPGRDLAGQAGIEGRQVDRARPPPARRFPRPRCENVSVADGVLKFDLKLEQEGLTIPFEGAIPKEGDKIRGSILLNGKAVPAELEKTTLTSFDPFDQLKEDLVKQAGEAEGVRTALELLGQAADKKAKPDEVRGWADKAVKWSEAVRRRAGIGRSSITVAETLADQEGFGARRAAIRPPGGAVAGPQEGLGRRAATRAEDAGRRLERLGQEGRGQGGARRGWKRSPWWPPPVYAGRKGKSDRVVLVELFTGAQCPPCVTADLAFDALDKTYKPDDVVLPGVPPAHPAARPADHPRQRGAGQVLQDRRARRRCSSTAR